MLLYAVVHSRHHGVNKTLIYFFQSFGGKVKSTQGGVNTPTRKGTKRRGELRRVPSKSEHHGHSRRTSAIPSDVSAAKEEEEEIDGANYIVFCKSLLKLIQVIIFSCHYFIT
ncbi:uncharacterized protein LOC144640257 [Oculina patagonica]